MSEALTGDGVYAPSDGVVAREIEGEVVIVPLKAGIGDLEDELYSLNETGRAVWRLLDGGRTLDGVVETLAAEYDAPRDEVERDVRGLLEELLRRGIARAVV
ncbi:MAG: PqqD family protein [Thermoleophilia bacterium]